LVYLARRNNGRPLQGREIAESCLMPPGRLLKILQQLVRARMLASERGPSGGFRLRRAPEDISLLEVIEALEGPIDGDLVVRHEVKGMERVKSQMEDACGRVADFARARLGEITIRDLIN
jgi:Rrf2 family protein